MKITQEAQNNKSLTLDELAEFVELAKNNGIPGNAIVGYRPSWGSKLREVSADNHKLLDMGDPDARPVNPSDLFGRTDG